MSLLEARKQYKPFEYPWAFDFWKRQQQIHWMPEEVPLGEDCRDWAQKLSDHERNLLTQIFRFFTQADVEVQDCYHEKYSSVFKPTEIKMMLAAFSNMETVHIAAYSHLLDTIGMPEGEYTAFLKYKEMKDKYDYMQSFRVDSKHEIAKTLAAFGAFTKTPSPLKLILLDLGKNTSFAGGTGAAKGLVVSAITQRLGRVAALAPRSSAGVDAGVEISSHFKPIQDYVGDGKTPAPIDEFVAAIKQAGSAALSACQLPIRAAAEPQPQLLTNPLGPRARSRRYLVWQRFSDRPRSAPLRVPNRFGGAPWQPSRPGPWLAGPRSSRYLTGRDGRGGWPMTR